MLLLGDRLAVGQQTLTLFTVVRIHVPQPFSLCSAVSLRLLVIEARHFKRLQFIYRPLSMLESLYGRDILT